MRRPPANPDADPLALDDETVERLLTGELSPAQAPPGYAEVAALLAATTAPPTPDELAGQAAALAELRAATQPRRAVVGFRRAAPPPRRRRVGLVAAALVGALVTGGAAAAATGNLPAPVRQVARSILGSVDGAEPARCPARPRLDTWLGRRDLRPPGPTADRRSRSWTGLHRRRDRTWPGQRGPLQGLPGRPGRRGGRQAGRGRVPGPGRAGRRPRQDRGVLRAAPAGRRQAQEGQGARAARRPGPRPGRRSGATAGGAAGHHRRRRPGAAGAEHVATRPLTGPAGAALLRSPQPMQERPRCAEAAARR
jgi:hypothetical protein